MKKQLRTTSTSLLKALAVVLILIISQFSNAQTGTWTQVTLSSPFPDFQQTLLLTDGTVICHNDNGVGAGTGWSRLTPDIHGSYVNGTWSTTADMNNDRLFFSSQVLPSGKVYVAGGEYGAGVNKGEVYDPVTNTWTNCGAVPSTSDEMDDANSSILPNGNILQALVFGDSTVGINCVCPYNNVVFTINQLFYNPTTNNYSVAPSCILGNDEANYIKLPDNSILYVGYSQTGNAQLSNRYIPSTNTWVNDAATAGSLYDLDLESGSALMLPNGKAIFFGATPYNVIYTPSGNSSPGAFSAADSFPIINGSYVGQPDAPGAMMVNGHILLAVSPISTSNQSYNTPTYFVEYDYTTGHFTQVTSPIPGVGGDSLPNDICQHTRFLDLPDGTVLMSIGQSNLSNNYYIYTPGSGPIAAGKPTINSVLPEACYSYKITGKLFNGISEGANFGDDAQMSTNFPLVRLTNSAGNIYYCRTSNWNRIGALQTDSLEDTAYFTVPPTLPIGTYSLVVVANGFASNPVLFNSTSLALNVTTLVTSNVTCNSGSNGSASATGSHGRTPYTYSWSNGGTTAIQNGLSAGTYTITLTDNNGCTAIAAATITQPSALGISVASITPIYCHGGTGSATANIAIGGTPPYTYSWTPYGGTNLTASNLAAGIYTITARDNHGCSSSASATITTPSTINFSQENAVQNFYIPAGVTSLTITAAGGAGGGQDPGYIGGPGAVITGVCTVTPGDKISIAVGSAGGTSFELDAGGGGGGTFVFDSNTGTLYVVGGGGGGMGYNANSGGSGGIDIVTNLTTMGFGVSDAAGGTGGNGGSGGYNTSNCGISGGGGGAGWISNGAPGIGANYLSFGGMDRANGFAGGAAFVDFSDVDSGGYGGGGGGTYDGGGGGGGYNGGGGGNDTCIGGGGGGGGASYLNGTVVGTPVANNYSAGYAIISYNFQFVSATATVTSNELCHGNSAGSAHVTPSGGNPPYTYSWSNGATTTAVSGLTAGSYTVTVSDVRGCSATARISITQPNSLKDSISVLVNIGCKGGNSGNLSVGTRGGFPPYTYSWSNGATTYTITNLTAGTYTVSISDNHGCGNTLSATLTQPATVLSSSLNTISYPECHSGKGSASVTTTGGTPAYKYLWSPNVSTTSSSTNLTAGTYTVTVEDAHGCKSVVNIIITQPNAIRDTVVASAKVNVDCRGNSDGSARIGVKYGTAPYTYSWSNGQTTATATGLSAGVYSVTVLDKNGCSGSTVTITITQPVANLTATIGSISCINSLVKATTIPVGGTSPYTYSWSPGGGTKATMSNLAPGTYTVTVTDKHGCSYSVISNLVCPPEIKDKLEGPDSQSGCCGGLENINLYPNPNTGQFTLSGLEKGMTVEMYDYTGRKISSVSAPDITIQLNLSNQANGVYFIRILDKDGNMVISKKVVKTN